MEASGALFASVLPTVLALVLAPHASLRNWLAVSRLPELALPVEDAEAVKKHRKRRSVLFLLSFAAFIGLEMACLTYADEGVINKIIMVVLALFLQTTVTVVMAEAFGACTWAAFRTEQGRLFFRVVPESKKRFRLAAAFIGAGLLNAGAIYCSHEVLFQAVVACIAYRMVASAPSRTISIRGIMALLLGWLAVSFTLSGILIALLIKSGEVDDLAKELEAESLATAADPTSSTAQLERMGGRLLSVITKSWFTAAPGILLAALYRFDYSQHVKRQAEEGLVNSVEVDFVEPIKSRCFGTSSPGVIVPSAVSRAFKRPFYQTAIFAWAISRALVAVGVEYLPMGDANKDDVVGILDLALEIPAMVVSVLVCAKIKGQFRDMWTYREEYSKRPSAAQAAVPADEQADAKLPSYADATDEEEGVPPYHVVDAKA